MVNKRGHYAGANLVASFSLTLVVLLVLAVTHFFLLQQKPFVSRHKEALLHRVLLISLQIEETATLEMENVVY